MTEQEHRARHLLLHRALDELLADWVWQTPSAFGNIHRPVMELLTWSHGQTILPTAPRGEQHEIPIDLTTAGSPEDQIKVLGAAVLALATAIVEVGKAHQITDGAQPLTGPQVLLLTAEIVRNAAAMTAALTWADTQLRMLVTDDDGSGVFIRGTGTELAGFGAGIAALRALI